MSTAAVAFLDTSVRPGCMAAALWMMAPDGSLASSNHMVLVYWFLVSVRSS